MQSTINGLYNKTWKTQFLKTTHRNNIDKEIKLDGY